MAGEVNFLYHLIMFFVIMGIRILPWIVIGSPHMREILGASVWQASSSARARLTDDRR